MLTGTRFFSPFYSFHIKFKKQKKIQPFPLLKLPFFPRNAVIDQMNAIQVVELTMLSRQFKRAVEQNKINVSNCEFLVGDVYKTVKVYTETGHLEIDAFCPYPGNETEWIMGRKLNGEEFPMTRPWSQFCSEMKVFTKTPELKFEIQEKITKHLLSICELGNFTFRCYRKWDIKNLFIWKYTQTMKRMQIHLLNRQKHLKLDDCSWMDFDFILPESTCEIVEFKLIDHPYKAITRMIKQWIDGKNEPLDELHFYMDGSYRREDDPSIKTANFNYLIGLNPKLSEFSAEDLRTRGIWTYWPHYSNMDVTRISDGRKATIVNDKHHISLYVWHEKYLEKCGKQKEKME